MDTFDYTMVIIRICIIFLGLLGNCLSFIIFLRPAFRKNSISTYCQALSIFDCFVLTQLAVDLDNVLFSSYLPSRSDTVCKIYFYLSVSLSTMSGWTLVAFSFDKILNMRRKNIRLIKKKWFQWALVAFITLFNLSLYLEIPFLLNLTIRRSVAVCSLNTIKNFITFAVIYMLESAIVPFILMIGASVLIIRAIRRSRRTIERAGKIDILRKNKDVKFAVSSLTFNILFVVSRVPLIAQFILGSYGISLGGYYFQFATTLFYGNSSAAVLTHFFSNSLFRRELLVLARLRRFNQVHTSANSNTNHVATTRKL